MPRSMPMMVSGRFLAASSATAEKAPRVRARPARAAGQALGLGQRGGAADGRAGARRDRRGASLRSVCRGPGAGLQRPVRCRGRGGAGRLARRAEQLARARAPSTAATAAARISRGCCCRPAECAPAAAPSMTELCGAQAQTPAVRSCWCPSQARGVPLALSEAGSGSPMLCRGPGLCLPAERAGRGSANSIASARGGRHCACTSSCAPVWEAGSAPAREARSWRPPGPGHGAANRRGGPGCGAAGSQPVRRASLPGSPRQTAPDRPSTPASGLPTAQREEHTPVQVTRRACRWPGLMAGAPAGCPAAGARPACRTPQPPHPPPAPQRGAPRAQGRGEVHLPGRSQPADGHPDQLPVLQQGHLPARADLQRGRRAGQDALPVPHGQEVSGQDARAGGAHAAGQGEAAADHPRHGGGHDQEGPHRQPGHHRQVGHLGCARACAHGAWCHALPLRAGPAGRQPARRAG